MNMLSRSLREITRYPSAVAGLLIIAILVGVSIYAPIVMPYSEAIRLWRGGVGVWEDNPRLAPPVWTNMFRNVDLPATIVLNSRDADDERSNKTVETISSGKSISIDFTFDYSYDGFPQEIVLLFTSKYVEKSPFVGLTWVKPDGTEVNLGNFSLKPSQGYYASQDDRLKRRLGGLNPQEGLFMDLTVETPVSIAVPGTYHLRVDGVAFEEDSDFDVKIVMYGKVHGIAGTDHLRRDLTVALLWGTPIALAFGLLAALGTSLTTMIIAGIGTWYGGWVDTLIQRITNVNLVLPFLSILIMVGTFYSRSIWLMLGVTILLSIFGGAILTYRAIFLQTRESPYIEAAQSYGASDWRIIMRYLVPRIVPLLLPQLVVLIPTFVFLEASLAVLGLGDPVLPTWGKIINDAQSNGALYQGHYYWVIQPAVLLMITGLAFSMLGFALDRVFNPRLRGQ